MQEANKKRVNRVYKSLHKPLTFMGVEKKLFLIICASAASAFDIFNSILAGIAVFVGGYAFGSWATEKDDIFLQLLVKSEKFNRRYDAAKQSVPRVEIR